MAVPLVIRPFAAVSPDAVQAAFAAPPSLAPLAGVAAAVGIKVHAVAMPQVIRPFALVLAAVRIEAEAAPMPFAVLSQLADVFFLAGAGCFFFHGSLAWGSGQFSGENYPRFRRFVQAEINFARQRQTNGAAAPALQLADLSGICFLIAFIPTAWYIRHSGCRPQAESGVFPLGAAAENHPDISRL